MELATLAQAAWRQPVAEVRTSGQRFAVGLRTLLPILEAAGALPELLRALRLRPAGELATLVLPAGPGQARVDLGDRQLAIPAALRDAIRAALDRAPDASPPRLTAAAPQGEVMMPPAALGAVATARLIGASAQASARIASRLVNPAQTSREEARAERAGRQMAHGVAPAPLPDTPDEAAFAAAGGRTAVERSGLFFESHLATWVRSGRTDGGEQGVIAELRQPPPPSPQRTAAQLDVLAHDAVRVQVAAWAGQRAQVELRRENDAQAPVAGAARVFSARLNLDLPRLGPVEVRLRLTGNAVAVSVACAAPGAIQAQLPQLAAQLELRGLQPRALKATAAS